MLRRLLVSLVLFVSIPGACLHAQTYTCAPTTSDASFSMREYMIRLVTATSDTSLVATRNAYHLSAVDSSKVSIVTTAKVCADAAIAYNKALHGASAPAVSRTMTVVKIGNTRYAIIDSVERYGEYEVNVITDSNFVVLAIFSG